MTKQAKAAGWPDAAALPFAPFGTPEALTGDQNRFMQPFAQSFAGGVDFVKKLWGGLPGGSAVPGFLVPTVDIDELDKRIKDLRAVESWLDMNVNLLRATIQGLEVQRNTIAAIQSIGASMAEASQVGGAGGGKPSTATGLPPGWPVGAPREHTPKEAEAAAAVKKTDTRTEKTDVRTSAAAPKAKDAASAAAGASPSLSAMTWLAYMQDQFNKVAEAALAKPALPEVAVPAREKPAKTRPDRPRSKTRPAGPGSLTRRKAPPHE